MKKILFSDTHSNLEALQSVLHYIKEYPDAQIYSLGDIVGYGANPRECIAEIKKVTHVSLAGNHDHAAIGLTDIHYFNPYAKKAVLWTENQLEETDKRYLSSLPLTMTFPAECTLVHSAPCEPEEWHYILTDPDANENFSGFITPLCFIGHSHVPMVFELRHTRIKKLDTEEIISLKAGHRYIINVGSVGQPRDGDWRACLLIYDNENHTIEYKRLEYDLLKAQEKIIDAGLPLILAERLRHGW